MVIRSRTGRRWLRTTTYFLLAGIVATVLVTAIRWLVEAPADIFPEESLTLVGIGLGALGLAALLASYGRLATMIGTLVTAIGTYGLFSMVLAYGGFDPAIRGLGLDLVEFASLPLNIAGPLTFAGIVIVGLARFQDRQTFLDLALAIAVVGIAANLLVNFGEAMLPELRLESLGHHHASSFDILLLVMFSVALATTALSAEDADFRGRGMFLPHFAFLLVLASSFNLWMYLVEREQAALVDQARDHAQRIEAVMREQQSDRLLALARMARRFEISAGEMSRELWVADAQRYLSAYRELIALGIISPERRIRWGVTLTNPNFGVGRRYGDDPVRGRMLRETREHGQPVLSPPMALFPEQAGQLAVLPLYHQDRFLGWLVGSYALDVLLRDLVEKVAYEYLVHVSIDGEPVFSNREDPGQPEGFLATNQYHAHGVTWTVEVGMTREMIDKRLPWLPSLMLLTGIVAAGLFGYSLFQLGQLRSRTAELGYSERRFRIIAEQTGEIIYDCDLATGEVLWAGAIEEIAGSDTPGFRDMNLADWMARVHVEDRARRPAPTLREGDETRRYQRHYRLRIDNHYIHVEDEGVVLTDEIGRPIRMLGAIKDISRRREQEQQLHYIAQHDELTGLLNREHFMDVLVARLAECTSAQQPAALVLLDLDRFRAINETLGYATGDSLLVAVARRLEDFASEEISLARISSDGFALLLQAATAERVHMFCQELVEAFSQPFNLDGHSLFATLTLGVSLFPGDSRSAEELFQAAETAVAQAKRRGRNQLLFFDPSMRGDAAGNLWIANKLRDALDNREFQLYFQPRVNLATGHITGMEALLRWFRPDGQAISPGRFIPVAEEIGMIGPIGWYVVDAAIDAAERLGPELMQERRIALNVSARQLMNRDFASELISRLAERGASPEWFEIELTESMLMDDPQLARELTSDLHRAGFHIAIDDFGTGYSSLNYLKHLAVDYLKIDQTFVRGLHRDEGDSEIVRTIIGMAHGLKLTLIAEGIEEDAQREFLLEAGCEEGQGFLMARPMPLEDLAKMLKDS